MITRIAAPEDFVTVVAQPHILKSFRSLLRLGGNRFLSSGQSHSMAHFRKVERILTSRQTMEGAGVKLKRAFADSSLLDPFLLLDEFHSNDPADYSAGFPWHPHRGFETVTYMLEGTIEHQDSAGNKGTIRPGGLQWMTAGRGIVHQEIPRGDDEGRLWGLQLWVNLPAAQKMSEPRYRGITSDQIPTVKLPSDAHARVICGSFQEKTGPVEGLAVECQYLDVTIQPDGSFECFIPKHHRAFVYVLAGRGGFGSKKVESVGPEHTIIYGGGEGIRVQSLGELLRCLVVSGEPIGERVAWRGPIVMNNEEELEEAYRQLDLGDFDFESE